MLKVAQLFTVIIFSNAVHAQGYPTVLEETLGAFEFATVHACASQEAERSGNLSSAILTPTLFKFDPTSNSVGVSMLNAGVKNLASIYTNNSVLLNMAPVVADCLGALAFFKFPDAAKLFAKKSAYGLADVALAATGHNATAGNTMLGLAYLANRAGFSGFSTLLYENAGLLFGDALFNVAHESPEFLAAIMLGSMLNSAKTIQSHGRAAVAVASGVALSSSVVLLKSLLG